MDIIKINGKQIKKMLEDKTNIISRGTGFGIIYKVNDNSLYKLYYGNLVLENDLYIYHTDNDSLETQFGKKLRLNRIMTNGLNIKHSVIPNGILTLDNKIIGIKENYLKDYINLSDYIIEHEDYKYFVERINEAIKELINNKIYPTDIKSDNIMINPETLDIKLIDLDDRCTTASLFYNSFKSDRTLRRTKDYCHRILRDD